MLKKSLFLSFVSCFLYLVPFFPVSAAEYIKNFDVYIKINPNSSLNVTEKITVNAEGNQIKRGIYKSFPTKYKTNTGYNKNTTFNVVSVEKNGVSEPFHITNQGNGKRLYIGQENTFLNPGEYNYIINYITNYQLGYFENHDELYYNAIGTGWNFPIEQATVQVELPSQFNKNQIQIKGFTGTQGSVANDYTTLLSKPGFDKNTIVKYTINKPLEPNQGLTIVIGFPKGYVQQPTQTDNFIKFIKDNRLTILWVISTTFAVILIFGYYLYYWIKIGKDPKSKGPIRNYDIPKNYSPASTNYIQKMGFDNKALTANIVSLAIKGYLIIKENKKLFSKQFTLVKTKKASTKTLFQDEKVILESIKWDSNNEFTFDKKEYTKTKNLLDSLKQNLDLMHKNITVIDNKKYLIFPIALTVILFLVSFFNFIILIILIPVHIFMYKALKARTATGVEVYNQVLGLKQYLSAVENPRYKSNLHKDFFSIKYILQLRVKCRKLESNKVNRITQVAKGLCLLMYRAGEGQTTA